LRRAILLSLFGVISVSVQAAKPTSSPPLQIGVDTEIANETRAGVRFEQASQRPRALYQPNFKATAADPDRMAREFLAARDSQ